MTLAQAKRGQICRIVSIIDTKVRDQAIRFGIVEGDVIACEEIIPAGGPIVLRKNHQQIALGRELACSFLVE